MTRRHKKPLMINPGACRPLPPESFFVEKREPRPTCSVCPRPAFWEVPPTPAQVVEQVEAGKAELVPMCSVCTLHCSVLFRGHRTKVKNFIKDVESEVGKIFRKRDGQLTEEADAQRVVGSVVATSIAFSRQDRLVEQITTRVTEDAGNILDEDNP